MNKYYSSWYYYDHETEDDTIILRRYTTEGLTGEELVEVKTGHAAAASDLLEACERMLKYRGVNIDAASVHDDSFEEKYEDDYDHLIAAIKKAKEEQ